MMRNMLQKTIVICTAWAMLLLMSACNGGGGGANGTDATANGNGTQNGTVTLTVAVMKNERVFDTIKQKFEASHPNIKVVFKEYYTDPIDKSSAGAMAQMTRDLEKIVTTVTTELASGKGTDLLLANNLPYKKFADKKLLTDVRTLMQNDSSFDKSNYYMNVMDALAYKGGYYAIPTSVQFTNLWVGDGRIVGGKINDASWTWQDFVDVTKPLIQAGGSAIGGMSIDMLLDTMLNPGISKFLDTAGKKASFDSPEFRSLLTLAKSMVDTNIVSGNMDDKGNLHLFDYFGFRYLQDFVLSTQGMFDGNGIVVKAPSVADNQGYAFRSNLTLAISDKSPNKQAAWELLKFVLSDDIQTDDSMRGMPISRSAFKAKSDQLRDITSLKNGKVNVSGAEIPIKPPTDADLARYESYMTGITTAQETDEKIITLVSDEAQTFFSGQKSAEQAARAIQSKVNTYLNE